MVWDTHLSKLMWDRATCYFYKQMSCQKDTVGS